MLFKIIITFNKCKTFRNNCSKEIMTSNILLNKYFQTLRLAEFTSIGTSTSSVYKTLAWKTLSICILALSIDHILVMNSYITDKIESSAPVQRFNWSKISWIENQVCTCQQHQPIRYRRSDLKFLQTSKVLQLFSLHLEFLFK